MIRRLLTTAAALSFVAACSSSGGATDSVVPVATPNGQTGPQRNLLISDLSFGSPGNGRAINETFDLAVTTFRVDTDEQGDRFPNGAGVLGLVQDSASSESFDEGNTLEFFAGSNTFIFNIDTDAGSFSRTVTDVLVDDPADAGLQNGAIAKLWGSNPTVGFQPDGTPIGFREAWPLQNVSNTRSVGQIAAELTRLQESDDEAEQDYYADYATAANRFIQNTDQFSYGYGYATGVGFFTATNMTSANAETETVAIGEFAELDDDGTESYGYFVYGHRTPLGEMPQTGTAEFEGKIVGGVLTNNSVRSLTGSVFLDVNFNTGLLDFSIASLIREGGNNEGATTFLDYKDLTGQGVITDTTFSGDIFETNGDANGEFEGAFFGPAANEAGGTFRFGDGASYAAGAFTASQASAEGN